MPDNFLRRKLGLPIEQALGPQSDLAQNADQAAAKLQALQALSNTQMAPSANRPFTNEEQDLKNQASMNAPMAMEQAAARLRAQADIDAAAEAHANELENPMDMSGYKSYPRFQDLQRKVSGEKGTLTDQDMKFAEKPRDIRESLKGMVEVTPELEKQLGYGPRDEEEDENAGKNLKYSSKETGTRGGI